MGNTRRAVGGLPQRMHPACYTEDGVVVVLSVEEEYRSVLREGEELRGGRAIL